MKQPQTDDAQAAFCVLAEQQQCAHLFETLHNLFIGTTDVLCFIILQRPEHQRYSTLRKASMVPLSLPFPTCSQEGGSVWSLPPHLLGLISTSRKTDTTAHTIQPHIPGACSSIWLIWSCSSSTSSCLAAQHNRRCTGRSGANAHVLLHFSLLNCCRSF